MGANVSALGGKAKRMAIVARTLAGGIAIAGRLPGEPPRGEAGSLSGVALRSAAAADDRAGGDALLSGLLAQWPRVEDLAAASLEAVIGAFAGLGYYSRARNLHACAQEIARRGGRFPSAEADLVALPGVGAYTAAAIAAIAFGQKAAPVDGNIARVLARISRSIRRSRAREATSRRRRGRSTPSERAGDFAQAMMDIGATICRPRNPDCPSCPLARTAERSGPGARSLPAAAPWRKRSRAGRARFSSPAAPTAPFSLAAVRRMVLLGSTVELPGTPWTSNGPRGELADLARSSQTGAGCRGRSSRSSPTSR